MKLQENAVSRAGGLIGARSEDLEIRRFEARDHLELQKFILDNLLQRARLANRHIYGSLSWLSLYLSCLAFAAHKFEPWNTSEWGRFFFLCSAFTALFLVAVDYPVFYYYDGQSKASLQTDEFLIDASNATQRKGYMCWLAMYQGQVTAVAVLKESSDADGRATIVHWYVRARYRGNGVGGDLLALALDHCVKSDLERVDIKTSSINKHANSTLSQFGFRRAKGSPDNRLLAFFNIYDIYWGIETSTWSEQRRDVSQSTA